MAEKKKKEDIKDIKKDTITSTENKSGENKIYYTLEEIEKMKKKKHREKIIQTLAVVGIISVVIFYLIISEFLFETSLFGLIFPQSRDEFFIFWDGVSGAFGENAIYDDWFGWGIWLPVMFVTLIEVLLTASMVALLAYSVREIFVLIRRLLTSTKHIIKELGDTTVESITEDEFGNKIYNVNKNRDSKKRFSRKERKQKDEEETKDEVSMVLDGLLTAPHTVDEEKIVRNIEEQLRRPTKPLFEDDER